MGFLHTCSFTTPIDADVHACDLPKLLHVLRPVFAPCEVSYRLGEAEMETLHASPRKFDEISIEHLTTYRPGPEDSPGRLRERGRRSG
jgi:hypothetical protein